MGVDPDDSVGRSNHDAQQAGKTRKSRTCFESLGPQGLLGHKSVVSAQPYLCTPADTMGLNMLEPLLVLCLDIG